MLILGLDPSTVATGWCLLATGDGGETVIGCGVFRPARLPSPAEMKKHGHHDLLLREAFYWLRGVIDAHHPDLVAIETPFFKLNVQTVTKLAQLGAAFRLAATVEGLPVIEIAPQQRCTAIGLAGNASKQQVLYTVNAVYNLALTDTDEADAVAVAAAGALRLRMEQMRTDADG